jgi:2,3-bisphosphoglycerate-dependent phosphoglycerate mutase
MTTFYLVRHAECEQNLAHNSCRVGGRSNDSPITPRGFFQIEAIANRLCSEQFSAIHSSTAVRAMKTAEGIAKALNYPLETVVRSDLLLEKDQGDWTGKTRSEILSPEFQAKLDEFDLSPQNGESYGVVANRMEKYLLDNLIPGKVLVVSHGNAIKSLVTKILGGKLGTSYKIHIGNTGITELRFKHNWQIYRVNDLAHIK